MLCVLLLGYLCSRVTWLYGRLMSQCCAIFTSPPPVLKANPPYPTVPRRLRQEAV